jgi:hypothetical protein
VQRVPEYPPPSLPSIITAVLARRNYVSGYSG